MMKVAELNFTVMYQKYITIEADDLTELLKDKIEVHQDDCYAVCSAYCTEDGMLMFNVLSSVIHGKHVLEEWINQRCLASLQWNKSLTVK